MALHVPRGIYTIVVSIRLDYCRRDCATSPSWSPAMKNCREQPRGRGHVTSAGLDACVAHSASAHRDRLAWELGELAAFARRKCMEAGGFGRGELGDSGDLGKFAAFARRKCMGGWRFRLRGVGGLGRLGEVCGIRPEEVHGRLAVSAALTSLLCTLLRLQSRQLRPHTFHDRRVDFRRCHQALSAAARLFHCRGKRGVQATEAAGEARSVRISIPGTTRRSCP